MYQIDLYFVSAVKQVSLVTVENVQIVVQIKSKSVWQEKTFIKTNIKTTYIYYDSNFIKTNTSFCVYICMHRRNAKGKISNLDKSFLNWGFPA